LKHKNTNKILYSIANLNKRRQYNITENSRNVSHTDLYMTYQLASTTSLYFNNTWRTRKQIDLL